MKKLALFCAVVALCGCSTVTRGTKDTWVVETTPPGATVTTSNGYHCAGTPCAIKMPRRSEFVATVEREGYETVTVNVTHQVSGQGGAAMAGNVLLGGVIGAAVDAGTGSMNDLVPNPVHLELVPLRMAGDGAVNGATAEAEAAGSR